MVTPFIKWAGGKKYLLPKLEDILYRINQCVYHYHEPMIGGGAVFYRFSESFKSRSIADLNDELINCYQVIQNNVEDLISELGTPTYLFKHKSDALSKNNYLTIRASEPDTPVKKAARTLFLLNGLMRKNKSGKFNVPMGSYKDPVICDKEHLREVSKFLTGVNIYHEDVCSYISNRVNEECFVFLDPPYDAESDRTKFTGYSGGFTDADQVKLIETLKKSGAKFIYTNRSTKLIRSAFGPGFKIISVPLRHSIQPKYTTGVVEKEIIVHNLNR